MLGLLDACILSELSRALSKKTELENLGYFVQSGTCWVGDEDARNMRTRRRNSVPGRLEKGEKKWEVGAGFLVTWRIQTVR